MVIPSTPPPLPHSESLYPMEGSTSITSFPLPSVQSASLSPDPPVSHSSSLVSPTSSDPPSTIPLQGAAHTASFEPRSCFPPSPSPGSTSTSLTPTTSSSSLAVIAPLHPIQTRSYCGIIKSCNILSLHTLCIESEPTSYTQASKDES